MPLATGEMSIASFIGEASKVLANGDYSPLEAARKINWKNVKSSAALGMLFPVFGFTGKALAPEVKVGEKALVAGLKQWLPTALSHVILFNGMTALQLLQANGRITKKDIPNFAFSTGEALILNAVHAKAVVNAQGAYQYGYINRLANEFYVKGLPFKDPKVQREVAQFMAYSKYAQTLEQNLKTTTALKGGRMVDMAKVRDYNADLFAVDSLGKPSTPYNNIYNLLRVGLDPHLDRNVGILWNSKKGSYTIVDINTGRPRPELSYDANTDKAIKVWNSSIDSLLKSGKINNKTSRGDIIQAVLDSRLSPVEKLAMQQISLSNKFDVMGQVKLTEANPYSYGMRVSSVAKNITLLKGDIISDLGKNVLTSLPKTKSGIVSEPTPKDILPKGGDYVKPTVPKAVSVGKYLEVAPINPDFLKTDEADKIFATISMAEAGQRIMLGEKETGEIKGFEAIPSTFPKWISPELRSKKLLDKVVKYFDNNTTPPAKNTREVRLYEEIKNEIESNLGVVKEMPTMEEFPPLEEDNGVSSKTDLLSQEEISKALLEDSLDSRDLSGKTFISFYYPDIESSHTTEEALQQLKKPNQEYLKDFLRTTSRKLSIENNIIEDGVILLEGKSSNSVVHQFQAPDIETAKVEANLQGLFDAQRILTLFQGDPRGKDTFYTVRFKTPQKIENIQKMFYNEGFDRINVSPDGTTVRLIDNNNKYGKQNFIKFLSRIKATATGSRGTVHEEGDAQAQSRVVALNNYRRRVQEYISRKGITAEHLHSDLGRILEQNLILNTHHLINGRVREWRDKEPYQYLKEGYIRELPSSYEGYSFKIKDLESVANEYWYMVTGFTDPTSDLSQGDNSARIGGILNNAIRRSYLAGTEYTTTNLINDLFDVDILETNTATQRKIKTQVSEILRYYKFDGKRIDSLVTLSSLLSRKAIDNGKIKVEYTGPVETVSLRDKIKALNKLAKENGFKDSGRMLKQWEMEKIDRIKNDDNYSFKEAFTNTESDTPKSDIVGIKNALEVQHNLKKSIEKGSINIGEIVSPTKGGPKAPPKTKEEVLKETTEALYTERRTVYKQIKDIFARAMESSKEITKNYFGEPETDATIVNNHPRIVNRRYDIINISRESTNWGFNQLAGITGDLMGGKGQSYEVMNHIVNDFNQLITLAEVGVTVEGVTREGLATDLDNYKDLYDSFPEVKGALVRWLSANKALREDLISKGKLEANFALDITMDRRNELEKRISDYTGIKGVKLEDWYLHHNVIDYINERLLGISGVGKKITKRYGGYLKGKTGTKRKIITDLNTILLDYFTTVKTDLLYEERSLKLLYQADLNKDLNDKEREAIIPLVQKGKIIDWDKVPNRLKSLPEYKRMIDSGEKFRIFIYGNRGRYKLMDDKMEAKLVSEAFENILTCKDFMELVGADKDKYMKLAEALGSKNPVFILPESVYKLANNIVPAESAEMKNIRNTIFGAYLRVWKPLVTKYLGGIPWRITNTAGDISITVLTDWATVLKASQASKLAITTLKHYGKDPLDKKTQRFLDECEKNRLLASAFFSPGITSVRTRNPAITKFNPVKIVDNALNVGSEFLELVPKFAFLLTELERIEKGEVPRLEGMDKYVKEMYKIGKEYTSLGFIEEGEKYIRESIFAAARGVTVDYSAMPPLFRHNFSMGFAPFAFWFQRMCAKTERLIHDKPWKGAIVALLIAAMTAYNNTGKRKVIEEGLPEYYRVIPHLNFEKKDGTPFIIRILPLDFLYETLLSISGLDKLPDVIVRVVDKKITAEEGVKEVLLNVPESILDYNMKMINPLVKAFSSIAYNKDDWTKKPIIPEYLDNVKGMTEEKIKLYSLYVATRLIPFYYRYTALQNDVDVAANPEDFTLRYLSKTFNPLSRIYKEFNYPQLMNNFIWKTAAESRAQREVLSQEYLAAFIKGDPEKATAAYNELSKKFGDDTPLILANVLKRSSTKYKIFQRFIQISKDDEERKAWKEMEYTIRLAENLQRVPKADLPYVLEQTLKLFPENK